MCHEELLTIPSNGFIMVNKSKSREIPVNSVAEFGCNKGYQLEGERTRVCMDTGYWSEGEAVQCIRKKCSNLPEIKLGRIELLNGSTDFGSMAKVICNENAQLSESEKLVLHCNIDANDEAKWFPQPMPTCNRKCAVYQPDNGKITKIIDSRGNLVKDSSKNPVQIGHNTILEIECDKGYALMKNDIFLALHPEQAREVFRKTLHNQSICVDGEWSRLIECKPGKLPVK
ncbi:hypothetical protein Ciccas_010614 [Cichlidogyrus casuarinus]|uniref:Sushi domain-containing protein n=1 Tax=Cichlidogyrus casuarinus TaxID=1844966 RepID=A0ABD2PTL8_9PLAT